MSVRLPQSDELVYVVRHWKETLDTNAKWWQRWFHRFAYLPFNEFSLKVMKIPPATSITIEGKRVTFSVVEDGGYFSSEHEADLACTTDRHSYQQMPYGRIYPKESAQVLGPTIFPRATNPRKRAKPILEMIIKSRREDDREHQQLAQCLAQLNQVLDR